MAWVLARLNRRTGTVLLGFLVVIAALSSSVGAWTQEEPAVAESEKEIRALLGSQNQNDWFTALQKLKPYCNQQNPWVRKLLNDFLAPDQPQEPLRTKLILGNEVMQTVWPGEEILLDLLVRRAEFQDRDEFEDQITVAVTNVAALGRERVQGLVVNALTRDEVGLFPQVLAIVAPLDPVAAVGAVIAQFDAGE